ncbi:MAG: DUF2252 family protein [Myxococcota bacterium]|nr:DUF2252 family protein [Myxococcota bacterium]
MSSFVCLLSSCTDHGRDRKAWLRSTLVRDHEFLIKRDPLLVEQKFAKMAYSAYNFFRATLNLFYQDQVTSTEYRLPTQFDSPNLLNTALLGDPHIENVGTYRDLRGDIRLEFNDFDAATVGPFHFDVRRLALSFYVAFTDKIASNQLASGLSESQLKYLVKGAVSGYVEGIREFSNDYELAAEALRSGISDSVVYQSLVLKAIEDGEAREALDEYTRTAGGFRRMFYGKVEEDGSGFINDRVLETTQYEQELIEQVLKNYLQNNKVYKSTTTNSVINEKTVVLKGTSRRYGSGVASYPLLRFYALVENMDDGSSDDVILEIKEAADPTLIPRVNYLQFPRFSENGERVSWFARKFHEVDDSDPWFGFGQFQPLSFIIRERTKFQKDFAVDKLRAGFVSGKWSLDEVWTMANLTGRLLARSHARGRVPGSELSFLSSINELIQSDSDAFINETVDAAMILGTRLLDDYRLFHELLEEYGLLLGYSGR